MKAWKKYLTGILALALVVGMVALLPHIHGEEFDENEYTFSEEETLESEIDSADSEAESESVQDELPIVESDEPMESEEPLESETPVESEITADGELDGEIEDAEDDTLQPAKLVLIPRELTEAEEFDDVFIRIAYCDRSCTFSDDSGETVQVIDCNMVGRMWASFDVGGDGSFRYRLDPSTYFTLCGDVGTGRIRINWGGDLYVGVVGTGIETILITKDGISVQGTNMNCQLFRNAETTCNKVILEVTNASRAVLLFEDDVFQGWADSSYTLKVIDLLSRSMTIASTTGTAADVYSIVNAETDSPQFTRVDVAE